MILFKILFWLIIVVLIWHLLTKKYLNPYKLYMVVGKKGSGKTTMLVRLAYEHIRKGWTVYSTEAIPGTYLIDYKDIGQFNIPSGSLLLVDEVGMIWDARKYKEFPDHLRDWFKYQRHEGVKVYLFSQTFDVDKKIRDLTDNMYLVTNVLRVFAYAKRIIKVPDLVKPSAEGPARLDDVLKFDSILWFWCGSRMFTFIPRYAKLFDSHARLGLPDKEYPYVDDMKVPRSLMKRKRSKSRTKTNRLFCCVAWLQGNAGGGRQRNAYGPRSSPQNNVFVSFGSGFPPFGKGTYAIYNDAPDHPPGASFLITDCLYPQSALLLKAKGHIDQIDAFDITHEGKYRL